MKKTIIFITILCTVFSALVSQEYIDSAFTLDGGEKAYFFSQNEYTRYDFDNNDTDPGYPRNVEYETWPGVTFSKIDAALNWGNGKVYLFSGNRYIRYDIDMDSADAGYPMYINNSTWPGLSFSSIDAAVNGGNGKAYFFSGSKYIQYDIRSDRSDFNSPKEISTFWRQVPYNKIDAALSFGDLIHLFSGDESVAFSLNRGNVIQRSPVSIANWNGIYDFSGNTNGNIAANGEQESTYTDNRDSGFSIDEFQLSVSPSVFNANSVLGSAHIIALNSGSYVLSYQNRDTVFFIELNDKFQRTGFEKSYPGYWFSDMIPGRGEGFYIALGKEINNTYLDGYPNTIFA